MAYLGIATPYNLRSTRTPVLRLGTPTSFIDPLVPPGATKSVSGRVLDVNAVAVVGATVLLFRTSDNLYCASTTSGANGVYSFPRRVDDPETYWTVAYTRTGGSIQVHGASNRGLVPA